jgi:hypothetical protein
VLVCRDAHPIRAKAAETLKLLRRCAAGGREESDAWEFRVSQQKIKLFSKKYWQFANILHKNNQKITDSSF